MSQAMDWAGVVAALKTAAASQPFYTPNAKLPVPAKHSLQADVFGTWLIVDTGSAPIAIAETGKVDCGTCGCSTTPESHVLSYSDRVIWVMPCHETYCNGHGEWWNSYENGSACENCETCPDCCDCYHCEHCCDAFTYSSSICSECNHCEDCCSGHEPPREEQYCGAVHNRAVPGWVTRGDVGLNHEPESVHYLTKDERDVLDPAAEMASFYLTEYVMTIGAKLLRCSSANEGFRSGRALMADAKRYQDAIVARCEPTFRDYLISACGGELRYHPNVNLPDACDYFYGLAEQNGRSLLMSDAVALFRDGGWESGFGGEKWAIIAEVSHLRENGTLDAKTFVDRVFSLQHNGGSALNKMSWAGYGPSYCKVVGDAHADRWIGFATLLDYASPDAIDLLSRLSSNEAWLIGDADAAAIAAALTTRQAPNYATPYRSSW